MINLMNQIFFQKQFVSNKRVAISRSNIAQFQNTWVVASFFCLLPSSNYTFQRINPTSAIGELEVNKHQLKKKKISSLEKLLD